MHWNQALYLYHLTRGGTYVGPWDDKWYSQLLLEHRGQTLVVQGEAIPSGRSYYQLARAIVPLDLEQPYRLTVSTHSPLNQGVNLVLGREDFGCPTLSRTRRIRAEHVPFTKLVLDQEALGQALEQWPDYGLSVRPAAPGLAQAHVVEVHGNMRALGLGLGIPLSGELLSASDSSRAEIQQRLEAGEYQITAFQRNLNGMISLAKAAWDALTRWPMGHM